MTDQRVWTHGAPAGYGIIFLRRGERNSLYSVVVILLILNCSQVEPRLYRRAYLPL
jgi:hypothetical protein